MNTKDIEAAESAIAANASFLKIEDTAADATGVFHLMVSLIHLCDAQGIDLAAEIENAQHHVRSDACGSPLAG